MFKINEIKELIRAVDRSTITELKIKGDDKTEITIRRGGAVAVEATEFQPVVIPATPAPVQEAAPQVEAAAPAPQAEATPASAEVVEDENLHKIVSPMVGTFYAAPAPDADPYVKAGDKVNAESIVCIVEAMKLMNELEAEVEGEIVKVLVENGQLVEYGQPLFLVKLA